MSKVAVGVDGGQSSTLCVVVDSAGTVLGSAVSGPSNHITEPGGPERCRAAVHGAVTGAVTNAGLSLSDVGFVLCGMTGAFPATREAVDKALGSIPHTMVHDSVTAFHGATGGQPGVVVIGGTGSVGYGEDVAGRSLRLGGWGYLMGDEGSAYWIALQAVQAVARVSDRRLGPSLLETLLPAAVGAIDVRALHTWLYSQSDRSAIARLAGAVDQAATQGDALAQRIMDEAGKELGGIAADVLEQLGFAETGAQASFVGGVFRSQAVQKAFAASAKARIPQVSVTPPLLPPIGGAALLALREMRYATGAAVLQRLGAGLQRVGFAQ